MKKRLRIFRRSKPDEHFAHWFLSIHCKISLRFIFLKISFLFKLRVFAWILLYSCFLLDTPDYMHSLNHCSSSLKTSTDCYPLCSTFVLTLKPPITLYFALFSVWSPFGLRLSLSFLFLFFAPSHTSTLFNPFPISSLFAVGYLYSNSIPSL